MINQTLLETRTKRPAMLYTGTPRRTTALLILGGLWLVIFFASLFTPPLLDDADATHANAARHMALSGDLVTLHVDGIRYLEKAPLPYWLVALSFRLVGFNTFAAHLPQAIAVFLLALLGYRWTERAFSPRAAFYTGLATLTSAGVFLFTRYFIPEVLLSLFLSTALYCLLRSLDDTKSSVSLHNWEKKESVILSEGGAFAAAVEGPAVKLATARSLPDKPSFSPTTHAYIMWTALALAVLTKGLVALVFFFGTAILYLALTGDYKKWRAAKTPDRHSPLPRNRRPLAHPRRPPQHRRHEWPRLLLVLLRQRALPPLPRQAISEGLQQTPQLSLLDSPPGLALPLEPLLRRPLPRRRRQLQPFQQDQPNRQPDLLLATLRRRRRWHLPSRHRTRSLPLHRLRRSPRLPRL